MRHRFNPWVGKILWRRAWQQTPVLLPGESHGQRSLESCSPCGCKQLDTTEATQHAHTHTHMHTHAHIHTCAHTYTHTHTHTHTALTPLCTFSHSVLSTKMGTLTICFFRLETSLEKSSNLPKTTQIKGGPSDSRAQYRLLGYTVSYFLFPNKLLFQLPRFTLSLASLPINFQYMENQKPDPIFREFTLCQWYSSHFLSSFEIQTIP